MTIWLIISTLLTGMLFGFAAFAALLFLVIHIDDKKNTELEKAVTGYVKRFGGSRADARKIVKDFNLY